jgi:AcrR family transcriptional regulator
MPTGDRSYHHGNLKTVLIAEGAELARTGGPAAVQLRDAARRAGVSHNAGYRHFADRDDYLDAVAAEGMAALAEAMQKALRKVPKSLAPADRAMARLAAIGTAYLRFALAEPGLFRTAFATRESVGSLSAESDGTPAGKGPFEILVHAIDDLEATGTLPAERRPYAEIVAWSAVHGLADLLLDGPLRTATPTEIDGMWERVSGAVLRGL